MNPLNPILPFNPQLPTDQVLALRQVLSILGGLSSNGPKLTPNAISPPPQPQPEMMAPILGGLNASRA